MNEVLRGAGVGVVAGGVAGLVGELGVLLLLQLTGADVWYVGLALFWGVVLGAVVGAYAGWRGRWPDVRSRAVVAAAPGFVAGIVAMTMQWSVG